MSPLRRAALVPVIFDVADTVSIVVVSAAEIDRRGGVDAAIRKQGQLSPAHRQRSIHPKVHDELGLD